MLEIKAIADMMEIIVKDCRKCPLERICDEFDDESDCSHIWKLFFETKAKEGGVEKLELEKILEEIAKNDYLSKCFKWYKNGLEEAERIIRKHMDSIDSSTDDLISRQALLEDFRNTITEQSNTLDWLGMIARQKTIQINDGKDINVPTKDNDGWIPVEKRLPEGNAVNPITRDAYVYPVTVDLGGITDVRYYSFFKGHWYNQSPKIMDDLVIAWKEKPELYRPEKGTE